MRKNKIKILFLILFFFASFVFAQEKLSLTITPPLIKVNFNRGQIWTSSVKIVNNNPQDLTLFVTAMDFKSGPEGGIVFLQQKTEEDKKFLLSQWIEFTEKEILVPAFQSKNVSFTIRVPENAEPGGKYAAILVGTKPPESVEGTAIKITPLVSCLILANVRGEVKEAIWIREFSTDKTFYQKPKVEFTLKIQNIGNVHIQPVGEIKIFNMYGKERGLIPFNQKTEYGNILPESSRKWNFTWEGEGSFFDIGRYKAVLTLIYGNEAKQTETRTIYFWLVPLVPVASTLGSILVFFAFLFLFVRFYVKRAVLVTLTKAQKEILITEKIPISAKEKKKISDIKKVGERKVGEIKIKERPAIPTSFRKKIILSIILFLVLLISAFSIYLTNVLKEKKEFKITSSQQQEEISPEKIVSEVEKEEIKEEKQKEIDKKSFLITVLNGSGFKGLASEVASKLEKEGFKIEKIGNADRFDYSQTLIKYKKEKEREAEFLNQFFKGKFKLIKVENQKEDIILIIGKDFTF